MGRHPKKPITLDTIVNEHGPVEPLIPTPISSLTLDYPSEQLNDMARKINEIIAHINA